MKLIKVGAAVLNQTPLDWDGNQANILAAIEAARADGVSLLCLPELCICGYGCEDAFHAPGVRRMSRRVLQAILPMTRGMGIVLGLPVLFHNALFNVACFVVDGRVAGLVAKRHLAGEGLHYEPRWFKPWPDGQRVEIDFDGQKVPMGDTHFDVGGIKVGLEICEDAWVAQRPGGAMAGRGVDIIMNPSASHFAFGKLEVRKRFVLEGSRAFGATYVYGNYVGNEAGRAIYDGGALIASAGELLAQGPRFTYRPFALTSAVIDIDATRTAQSRTGSFVPTIDQDELCVRADLQYPTTAPVKRQLGVQDWEHSKSLPEEEFTRAISLGLFDYMRKSRSHGFVVSLSGGADSTVVSCLVALMLKLATVEIGIDALRSRLAYIPGVAASGDRELAHRLLTCVYQSTRNSSRTTQDAARTVAEAIGAEFLCLDVDAMVQQYIGIVESAIGRELSWASDDLALQNIQARVRGPGVWMLANLKNALLLATSNRSEAAVGYATMDGDTCGGLSPIAGIDKAFIRRYLVWLQLYGPAGIGPIPSVSVVTGQEPTAELRPPEQHQTDEDDLMPYEVLDAIEDLAIGRKCMPDEVLAQIQVEFNAYPSDKLKLWVERFFRLWCRNQWKRERYAPALHVDDKNLDPRSWCRFPILSGGFARELKEL